MKYKESETKEKVVTSNPSFETEVNTARINALELKLETLSLISEAMWNIMSKGDVNYDSALKAEMAKVITARAKRDALEVKCEACGLCGKASTGFCANCGEELVCTVVHSPFDY